MKNIVIISFLSLIFSCNSPITEKVEKTFPDNNPKLVSYYQKHFSKEEKVEQKEFYINGQVRLTGKFKDGLRDGEWKAFFEDGSPWSIGTFKQGKREGLAKVYYSNGKVRYEGQYNNDKQIGHWKFYNEKGELVTEKDF